MSEERKGYMSDDDKNTDKIESDIRSDADKLGVKSRFGYFSIPYSSFMGDKFYSQGRTKVYRTEDKNVLIGPRGIFTKPVKQGKAPDVYFSNAFKEDKETLKRIKEMADKEKEEYKKVVKSRMKGGAPEDPDKVYKANFKPTGPQEYKDLYDKNPVKYKIPITKTGDKLAKIDKEHRTVFTEKRGILTKPTPVGSCNTPGVLFGYYKDDKKMLERKAKIAEEMSKLKVRSNSAKQEGAEGAEGADYKRAFKPAALKKNEAFQKDKLIYGEDDKKNRGLLEHAIEFRHKGKGKFIPELPTSAIKQAFAFKPTALIKTGRQSQFKPIYGIPFIAHEKVIHKKKDKDEPKTFKKEFTYNRLADCSVFSPPMTSFISNMKKEFPRVFTK